MIKIFNVDWDYDDEDIDSYIVESDKQQLSKLAKVSVNEIEAMDEDTLIDFISSKLHHNMISFGDLAGLPEEIIVPETVEKAALESGDNCERDEILTEWLADEYGWCFSSFELEVGV